MSLFSKILEKIGIGKKDEVAGATAAAAAAPAKPAAPQAVAATPAKPAAPATPAKPAAPATPASPAIPAAYAGSTGKSMPPKAISQVDVVKHLEELAKGKKLDWKVSIVDLLKLLDIDSSFEARKELATELGCPADLMGDSAKMNVWLHKEVLKQIAANGGNIPKELLD
ncbi:MAG: DUF3597 domain-containing protein [Anaerolineales bacterium]|nr:DUF3597 domain-containing protein [Anaerolineales bacterium]